MTPLKPVQLAIKARGIVLVDEKWHRLHGGRTNSVWRIESVTGPLVCKLFERIVDNPLYPNLPQAEFEILTALSGQGLAPEPVAQIATSVGEVLVYKYIEGQSWRHGVQDVAALLTKIHAQPCAAQFRHVPSGSAALIRQTKNILSQCQNPRIAGPPFGFDPGLAPIAKTALIHTDVVPNNIVSTPHGLCLIDWQCPGMGDPCEDIASFLSPSMQYLYGATALSDEQSEAFLVAYDRPAIAARYRRLAPLFHWRAAAYCLWKSERGFAGYQDALSLELSALQEAHRQYNEAGKNNADADVTHRSDCG